MDAMFGDEDAINPYDQMDDEVKKSAYDEAIVSSMGDQDNELPKDEADELNDVSLEPGKPADAEKTEKTADTEDEKDPAKDEKDQENRAPELPSRDRRRSSQMPTVGGSGVADWTLEWYGKSEMRRVEVRPPEMRGSNPFNKHHVYQIASGTEKESDFVFRRYSDFFWLRDVLAKMYPAVFLPPLPPKKAVGSQNSYFVAGRRVGLERFLNRLQRIGFMRETDAYKLFFTEQDQKAFEAKAKDLKEVIALETVGTKVNRYYEQFPILSDPNKPSGFVFQEYEALQTFIEDVKQKLDNLLEVAEKMSADKCEVVNATRNMNRLLEKVYTVEAQSHFPQLPQRLDILKQLEAWHEQSKEYADSHHHLLSMPITQEIQDIKAFLEAIKQRQALVKDLDKASAAAKKLLASTPSTPLCNEAVEREKHCTNLLEMATTMLLGPQLKYFWEERMARFKKTLQLFAKEQLKLTKKSMELWKSLHETAAAVQPCHVSSFGQDKSSAAPTNPSADAAADVAADAEDSPAESQNEF